MRQQNAIALRSSSLRFAGTTFVDVHLQDVERASSLLASLRGCGVTPLLLPMDSSGEHSPETQSALFADLVRKADRVIVVFGQVARDWVDERLNEAFKLSLSERLPTKIGVYLAPANNAERDIRFPGLFTVINDALLPSGGALGAFLREDFAA